jgi:hypothetical protein
MPVRVSDRGHRCAAVSPLTIPAVAWMRAGAYTTTLHIGVKRLMKILPRAIRSASAASSFRAADYGGEVAAAATW